MDEVVNIDKDQRHVKTALGEYEYDWLVIATGCRIAPEEIDGMMDGWGKDIFDFYTLEGAIELRKKLKYFKSGKIVLNIAEIPYKCPIAPLEFVFMADWFFTVTGVRTQVDIELVTPLDNVFTKLPAKMDLSQAQEVGLFGMLQALREKEIRQGLGVLLELTRGLSAVKN